MKTLLFYVIVLFFLSTLSCTKEENTNLPENPIEVANTMINGDWKITYFWDSDHDETQHFTGYAFSFKNSGTLTASNGMNTVNGTWSTGNDDNQVKMMINFASPPEFEELSDDWHVLESTRNKIRLEDVSGGNGGTDYLTFEKL